MPIYFNRDQFEIANRRTHKRLVSYDYELALAWLESNYQTVSMTAFCDSISRAINHPMGLEKSRRLVSEYMEIVGKPNICPVTRIVKKN